MCAKNNQIIFAYEIVILYLNRRKNDQTNIWKRMPFTDRLNCETVYPLRAWNMCGFVNSWAHKKVTNWRKFISFWFVHMKVGFDLCVCVFEWMSHFSCRICYGIFMNLHNFKWITLALFHQFISIHFSCLWTHFDFMICTTKENIFFHFLWLDHNLNFQNGWNC